LKTIYFPAKNLQKARGNLKGGITIQNYLEDEKLALIQERLGTIFHPNKLT